MDAERVEGPVMLVREEELKRALEKIKKGKLPGLRRFHFIW